MQDPAVPALLKEDCTSPLVLRVAHGLWPGRAGKNLGLLESPVG